MTIRRAPRSADPSTGTAPGTDADLARGVAGNATLISGKAAPTDNARIDTVGTGCEAGPPLAAQPGELSFRVIFELGKVIGGLPPGTPAAFEAAYRTSWLVELLEDYGFAPHLARPSRCKAIASARLKNDKLDAILAQLLRADLLPEAWTPARGAPAAGAAAAPGGAGAAADPAAQPDPCHRGRLRP